LFKLEATTTALIESEKMATIGLLTAGVAHDINNPLNFISLGIDNAKEIVEQIDQSRIIDINSLEELKTLLSYAETGVKRINGIVDSLRTYSRSSKMDPQLVNIIELIRFSVTIIKSKIPSYINLEYSYSDISKIRCNENQISQVLINIINNAIDSIAEKIQYDNERIVIKTGLVELTNINYLSIQIINTGKRLEEDAINKIFEAFYTTKQPKRGSGLGLYISNEIIKAHHGILRAFNDEDMVVFEILLPL
jgi:two-component system, NtrC family, sensor kinase